MYAFTTPSENLHTNPFFERDNLLTERGLGQEKPFRGSREMSCLRNSHDVLEKPEFKKVRHSSDSSVGGFWSEAHFTAPVEIKDRIRVHWKNQDCQSGTFRFPSTLIWL